MKERVKQGGHHIAEETIKRRYFTGLKNLLTHYLPLADTANILNNSSEQSLMRMIARKTKNQPIEILDPTTWEKLERASHER